MSRKFLAHIDLNSNELQNAVIQNLSSAPTGVLGRIYFDTAANLNQLKIYNGTAWSTVGSVSLTLQGDVTGTASTNSSGEITLTATVDYAGSLTGADVNTALGYTAADAADVSALATSITTGTIDATTVNTVDLNASGEITLTGAGDFTITGDNNVVIVPGSGDFVYLGSTSTADNKIATLGDLDTVSGDLSTHEGLTSGVHGTSGSVVGTSDTQTLTNKTLGSGTALDADLDAGSNKITNLDNPTNAQDAATKGYVDSVSQGLDIKDAVRAATATNGTLATAFANGQVIDGVTLVTNDRILLKSQTTGSENGIYTVNSSGAPTRSIDANVSSEVTAGMFVFVSEGTANGNSGWVLTTDNPITLGTTALVFAQFSGAGTYTNGDGIDLTGVTFSINLDSDSLAVSGSGLKANLANNGGLDNNSGLYVKTADGIVLDGSGNVTIDTTVVARKYSATLADGDDSYVVTHNLGTLDVQVQLYDPSGYTVEADISRTGIDAILVQTSANTLVDLRVVVIG